MKHNSDGKRRFYSSLSNKKNPALLNEFPLGLDVLAHNQEVSVKITD